LAKEFFVASKLQASKQPCKNSCIYYEYALKIIDETDTTFALSNCGESVDETDAINIQFMIIKDALGFVQTDRGTFEKIVSKFDDHIRVDAIKLVFFDGWLMRVLQENAADYLLIATGDATLDREQNGWQAVDDFYIKWVRRIDTKAVEAFISYWGRV
jgi:hypothetical protein